MVSSEVITVLRHPVVSVGASAVAGGAWALVPVGRARGLTRALLVGLPAVAATAAVARGQQAGAVPGSRSPLRAAVVPAAAGGVVAFTHWAALALDHGIEAFVARRGVRRPRLVMAAVSAVVTSLMAVLDRSADGDERGRGPRTSA